jgi:hypothetical protein
MSKIWQKLTALTTGAFLSWLAIEANPAQAAVFHFFSEGNGRLFGDLVFNDATSGLTGIGTEEASLSQLQGNFLFQFETFTGFGPPRFDPWDVDDLLSPPIFSFESGNLIGINLNLAPKFSGAALSPFQFSSSKQELIVTGANFTQTVLSTSTSCRNTFFPFPPFFRVECVDFTLPPFVINSGRINFTTVVPFKRPTSVPEPASVVGLSLLGLAFLLNKKTASSQG